MKLDDIDNMRHFIERNGYKQFIEKHSFLKKLKNKQSIVHWIDNEDLSLNIDLNNQKMIQEKIKASKQQLEDLVIRHNKGSNQVEVISDSEDEIQLLDNTSNTKEENVSKRKKILRKCFIFGDCMTGQAHVIHEIYVDEFMY